MNASHYPIGFESEPNRQKNVCEGELIAADCDFV